MLIYKFNYESWCDKEIHYWQIYTESHDFRTKQFAVDLSILLHFVIVTFHANAAGLLILRDIISPI